MRWKERSLGERSALVACLVFITAALALTGNSARNYFRLRESLESIHASPEMMDSLEPLVFNMYLGGGGAVIGLLLASWIVFSEPVRPTPRPSTTPPETMWSGQRRRDRPRRQKPKRKPRPKRNRRGK